MGRMEGWRRKGEEEGEKRVREEEGRRKEGGKGRKESREVSSLTESASLAMRGNSSTRRGSFLAN